MKETTNYHMNKSLSNSFHPVILKNPAFSSRNSKTNKGYSKENVLNDGSKKTAVKDEGAKEDSKRPLDSPQKKTPSKNVSEKLARTKVAISRRLSFFPAMLNSVSLIDEHLNWWDRFYDYLVGQDGFLVIGVLGKQNVGKSTILSLLAGNNFTDEDRKMIFLPTNQRTKATSHCTTLGVDAFVSSERTIFLDTQPVLSAAVLHRVLFNYRKRLSHHYKSLDNYIEIQSLQLACFLLSVCHVVLIIEDWFTDVEIYRFLQSVELIRHNVSKKVLRDFNFGVETSLVFVQNKHDAILPDEIAKMKRGVNVFMKNTEYQYTGLTHKEDDVNLIVLPRFSCANDWTSDETTKFRGISNLEKSIGKLRDCLFGISRHHDVMFTEKNWFEFASKMWESIRESRIFEDYIRSLT